MTLNINNIVSQDGTTVPINPSVVINQIGNSVGNLNILGGLTQNVTAPSAYPYTILTTDNLIAVSTTAAARTINLPATLVEGQTYLVKDVTGQAATNNITISGNGNTIDGAATVTISTNYGAYAFIGGPSQWGATSINTGGTTGITTVGDVTSGSVAFNGSIGTTLISTTAGFSLLAINNSSGVGGAVSLTGGATTNATSAGGSATLRGGAGNTSGAGGLASVLGGTPGITGIGGGVTITAANGGATSGSGGALTVTSGSGTAGSSAGGNLSITAGSGVAATGGAAGAITIQSGTGGLATVGGAITITGGTGTTSGGGGGVTINGGAAGSSSSIPGRVTINGGTGGATNANGGIVVINGGTGTGSGAGGSVTINGGSPTGGGGGNGGGVTVQGASGSLVGGGGSLLFSSGSAGSSGTIGNITINFGTASGTDINGPTLSIGGAVSNGLSTGAGHVSQIFLKADTCAIASSSTTRATVNRLILNGSVALTSASASTIATMTLASGSSSGGTINYLIECTDGTDYQSVSGVVAFSGINKAATKSGACSVQGAEAITASTGTLTDIWTVTSAGLVQVTPTTSLTATFFQITYTIFCHSSKQTITIP